jgi:large subunit ribosomal protein L24
MMKAKIRKGDQVVVISGKTEDKGKKGEVIKVLPDEGRVVVQGINMHYKHQSEVQARGRSVAPGKIRFEAPFHISNVMLVCPKCGKPTRIGISRNGDDVQRVCKQCEEVID